MPDCQKDAKDLIVYYSSLVELEHRQLWGDAKPLAKVLLDEADKLPLLGEKTKEQLKKMLSGVVNSFVTPSYHVIPGTGADVYLNAVSNYLDSITDSIIECVMKGD